MVILAAAPALDPGSAGAGGGTALVPDLAAATRSTEADGVAPRPGLPEQIVAVLEDDRMSAAEIRRQLAKTGVDVGEGPLWLCLHVMAWGGLVETREILDTLTWRVAP
jgi:hypothetical protein